MAALRGVRGGDVSYERGTPVPHSGLQRIFLNNPKEHNPQTYGRKNRRDIRESLQLKSWISGPCRAKNPLVVRCVAILLDIRQKCMF